MSCFHPAVPGLVVVKPKHKENYINKTDYPAVPGLVVVKPKHKDRYIHKKLNFSMKKN